jgi:transcriptional regulator
MDKMDVPQGTLDMLILTILNRGPMHGYGISQRLAELTRDGFQVNPGSLFPALYKLEQDGKLRSKWGSSESNRNAKYYSLTRAGRKQLERARERWERVTEMVASVLEGA